MKVPKFKISIDKKDAIYLASICLVIIILFLLTMNSAKAGTWLNKLTRGNDFLLLREDCKKLIGDNGNGLYPPSIGQDLGTDTKLEKRVRQHYSPIFYYFFLPFSFFSPFWSMFFSFLFFMVLYLASVLLLINLFRRFVKFRFFYILLSLVFPPFLFVMITGSVSVLWLFILTLAFYLSKKGKFFISGLVLSTLIMHPVFFLLVFLIILLSFKPRIFFGILSGSVFLFLFSGVWNKFYLWGEWFKIADIFKTNFLGMDYLALTRSSSLRSFFYPIYSGKGALVFVQYAFIIIGLISLAAPIIYSIYRKKNFSRNSFWLMVPFVMILANPYAYYYDLIILFLPTVIFFNLMLADRVEYKYMALIIALVSLAFIIFDVLCLLIHIQLFVLIFWFFLINGMLAKRVRQYTPKTFIGYWEDY